MSEEESEQREEHEEPIEPKSPVTERAVARRRYFTRRNAGITGGALALLIVLLAVLTFVFYRYGVIDNYVKAQFVAKMARIGMDFDADVFRVTIAPLQLELKNATFNDRVSGEKLFFIREAHLGLTVQDLYAWQLSRDLTIDTTDITGAEVWIKFDENGRSNFDNLTLVEEEPGRINFRYESVRFSLRDSVVHFGDLSRNIAADANNVVFNLEPEQLGVPEDQRRYRLSLNTTDSTFTYKDGTLENIDVEARGIADGNGADVTDVKITTPIGEAVLNGRLDDWASIKYNFNVESTLDLTQASNTFPLGTPLRGVGNFKGNISGEGETYRVSGVADSQALTAEGIYLRGVNIEATVAGTNSNYEANGTAVAELLTFEDFRIEFPRLAGNVRGTGTDFRWVGELQAIAARSDSLTLGRLFLSDAVAELKDRELTLFAGRGRAGEFVAGDTRITDLSGTNIRYSQPGGVTNFAASGARAGSLVQGDTLELFDVSGNNLRVRSSGGRTDVDITNLRSQTAEIEDARLRNLTAAGFTFRDLPSGTEAQLTNVRAENLSMSGAAIAGLQSPSLSIRDTGAETIVYSDSVRLARLQSSAATLGNLNIAGVRLTIRQGTVTGTSGDINAGNIQLARSSTLPQGGSLQAVQIRKPVFVLEPSGRYRATADMSIGGGVLGSIDLGAARADVVASSDRIQLNNLNAQVMEGEAVGAAAIALNRGGKSNITADFKNLDVAKLLALQGGRVLPIEGNTTGSVDLAFNGTDLRNATGSINADITANAGADANRVPINGRVELTATNGLFDVRYARLNSPNAELNATGRFDLRNEDSNLNISLNSSDAAEISRLITTFGFSPELEQQIISNDVQFGGKLAFNGTVTGNLSDPTIDGRASLDSVLMRGRELGAVSSEIFVSPAGFEIRNGRLTERDGGTMAFAVSSPSGGVNNTSIQATLTNIDAANLIAALPIAGLLPQGIRDFSAQTSGTVNITGLPNNAMGGIDISSSQGVVAGQDFNAFQAKATFQGTLINLENLQMNTADGALTARGTYDRSTTAFNFDVTGKNVQVAGLRTLLPNTSIPAVTGLSDFTATITGETDRASSYNVNFNGTARGVRVNEYALGDVTFNGTTVDQQLNANVTATIEGRPQVISANVNFADENLPFRMQTELNQSPIEPYLAFFPQLAGQPIGGVATGRVDISGNLSGLDANGVRVFSAANLTGSATFSQLNLRFQDTPLIASEPVTVQFNTNELVINNARFAGGGSNMTVNGTIALNGSGNNNFAIDGRVNLNLLNLASRDTFFSGFADVSIRYAGVGDTARLTGTANVDNASVSAFVGSDRVTFDRVKTNIIFTSDQAQIQQATGYLGGGRFVASGGARLSGLTLSEFRLDLTGTNITVPLPNDFITTGDARLQVAGTRGLMNGQPDITRPLQIRVVGRIAAKRSVYSEDIELASIVGSRHDASLSAGGGSTIAPLQFDLTIEGRDALIVRNNIADLTASVSLHLTGDADNPQVTGRITANSGLIFFRNDRYSVQRAVLEFPPDTAIEPIISLQAETEIAGHQIFVNLSGPLTDTEQLTAVVRSSPALPQADVVSLITTGNLANTESGIPTLAQTGINTAAEVLADAIINEPVRKATDKLFGLNVFEIDPIISGERLNPSARLTVGRQINNNLRVTYSTNLSQDQNQVLALEYRVSNKLSFVAQYEQRSLSNVTRNRDNFSFEIRFRRRF